MARKRSGTSAWWQLWSDIAMSGLEAQRVMGLRFARLAAGGPQAAREARLMISEKAIANTKAVVAIATGASAQSVVSGYRTIVRANDRRLSKRKR